MQKLSDTKILPVVTKLLILLLLAKLIALVVWWYLPSEGVELNAKKSYQAKYQRVDFKNMLIPLKRTKVKQKEITAPSYSINSLILKGLYGNKSYGYAIVAKKTQPTKTTLVSIGEVYAGYKLKEIDLTQVIFTKSKKEYVLALEKPKGKGAISRRVQKVQNVTSEQESEHSVSKGDIEFYSSNPSQIWKDIAIAPVRKNGKIEGFKVNRIKAGSKMSMLGLQRGDIIIRANNVQLSSFNDALNIYKNIDKIDTVELVVLRNNQEKEIIYEIH